MYRVNQHFIVLYLDSASINKVPVTKFSKVIECLEQNIRKQIDCKRPLNTKQMNRVRNIRIEIWKYKADECFEI